MELARKAGIGTVPTASPRDVATKAATTQVSADHPSPAADGLAAVPKTGLPWIAIGRSALALLCASPLIVAAWSSIVPHAPMKDQDGTWSSDAWQHDLPSGFRTKARDGVLTFYAAGAGGACGPAIGSAPALGDDPSPGAGGTLGGVNVTLSRDRGLLAVAYDQYDPWVFFSRGPSPRHRVTVRFHQTATEACTG